MNSWLLTLLVALNLLILLITVGTYLCRFAKEKAMSPLSGEPDRSLM